MHCIPKIAQLSVFDVIFSLIQLSQDFKVSIKLVDH